MSSKLYTDDYFLDRTGNNPKRLASFQKEAEWMQKFVSFQGACCDVGCSTGEFLSAIEWLGPKYGMEVNEAAIARAKEAGVQFDRTILSEDSFFDSVIFRGTIQHIDQPFYYIQRAFKALKPGGHIFFLATPNTNSILFKIWNDLPALSERLNYYLPSDRNLANILKNEGFEAISIEYPYIDSPYSSPITDHYKFFMRILDRKRPDFPFWRSMMNVVVRKPI